MRELDHAHALHHQSLGKVLRLPLVECDFLHAQEPRQLRDTFFNEAVIRGVTWRHREVLCVHAVEVIVINRRLRHEEFHKDGERVSIRNQDADCSQVFLAGQVNSEPRALTGEIFQLDVALLALPCQHVHPRDFGTHPLIQVLGLEIVLMKR